MNMKTDGEDDVGKPIEIDKTDENNDDLKSADGEKKLDEPMPVEEDPPVGDDDVLPPVQQIDENITETDIEDGLIAQEKLKSEINKVDVENQKDGGKNGEVDINVSNESMTNIELNTTAEPMECERTGLNSMALPNDVVMLESVSVYSCNFHQV